MAQNIFEGSNSNRGNMHFIKTMSVADFKAKFNIESIELIANPHTGKVFFSYGRTDEGASLNGIVSANGKGQERTIPATMRNPDGTSTTVDVKFKQLMNPVISEVVFDATGETSYMLHEENKSSNNFMSL